MGEIKNKSYTITFSMKASPAGVSEKLDYHDSSNHYIVIKGEDNSKSVVKGYDHSGHRIFHHSQSPGKPTLTKGMLIEVQEVKNVVHVVSESIGHRVGKIEYNDLAGWVT